MDAEQAPSIRFRLLGAGDGWQVRDVVCRHGPADRRFEEQHAWTAIACVLNGIFTYRTTQGSALMTPGSILLGEPGACFECGHAHGVGDRCISFHISPEIMEEVRAQAAGAATGFTAPRLPPRQILLPLHAGAQALAASPDPLRAEALMLRIASAVTNAMVETNASRKPISAREQAVIADAVRQIRRHHAQALSIASLAAAAGLGRQRFATIFRRLVGVTPYNYVLSCRLNAAARELRCNRTKSVLDIALGCGFGDLSEFTRRFHTHFGKPPGAYRREGLAPARPLP